MMNEKQSGHPSRVECMELLKEYHTPPHVIRHCVAVTETALKIASALNEHGYQLDLDLLQGAGLLHDIARVEENHAEVAADLLESLGYQQEADLVRVHMFYIGDPGKEHITEVDILCLSDRMVKENKFVGLEKRMSYILNKFKGDHQATERITKRMNQAKMLVDRIEEVIGMSLFQLMGQ